MTKTTADQLPACSRLNRRTFNKFALAGAGGVLGVHRWAFGEETAKPTGQEPTVEPLSFVDGSFTLVALPDTQHYCQRFPQHFYNQTDWIVRNKDKHDIQFVMHLGDITNNNVPQQWEVAQKAIGTLHGEASYSLAPGNHDLGPNGGCANRETLLNDYFPSSKAHQQPTFGGWMTPGLLENTYHTFPARGLNFLVLALEWGPRDETVEWANRVVAQFPDHHAILTTHAYMYFDETRYDFAKYGKRQSWNPHSYPTAKLEGGTNDGQELWDKLVSKHKNFFLTLNGHVLNDGQALLTSKGAEGNDVHQVLTNFQMLKEGGEGYLRLIEFLPDGKTVQMKTYSPSLDQYKTDPQNQFVLKLSPS